MQIPGYRIIRKINQGGMSTVYLAIQLSVGREVALKVMSPALNADPVFSERFQREANIVGQLSHPNIVAVYDIGRFKNLNYIAMDYLAGGSIHDRMKSGLSAVEALRITSQIANALDHAHEKGYIHRDIKPENVLFREDGTAVLSDFGVAKTVSTVSNMTNAGTVVGTPHYMSPEQARGKPIDGRADLYSLGVVFFEMITGSVPYTAEEAVAIAIKHLTAPVPKLPPQYSMFQPFLNKLLAKDPNDRFQRGHEVVEAIAQLQGTSRVATPNYLTETDPSAIQILSLFKALVLTSYAALAAQCKLAVLWLASWRWTPKRGVYRHPRVTVTEIRTSAETIEEDRATIISTRVQKAAHYQTLENRRVSRVYRTCMLLALLGIIWIALSMGLGRIIDSRNTNLPHSLSAAILATNQWVEELLIKSDKSAGQEIPAVTTPSAPAEVVVAPAETAETTPVTEATTPSVAETSTPPVVEPEIPAPPAPPPPRFGLSVNASPIEARVRVLNIRERYYTGIPLLPGRYQVEVSAEGYDRDLQWVEITDRPLALNVSLRKIPVPGATFHNELADGSLGPAMVIVPAGNFVMGNAGNSLTSPTRRVRIRQPFAISQYEITFADYDKFARATSRPLPADGQWGRGSRPVINISWDDARAYARWLRESTGRKYRLPTEAEWEYVARAGTSDDYWWQGAVSGKANCRWGCNSDYSNLLRTKTAPVGSYPANRFGVFDTAGNVAEWVADCFQPHYLAAPQDGSAVELPECSDRVLRGGSIRSGEAEIKNHYRDHRAGGKAYGDVGIRVVVDLY